MERIPVNHKNGTYDIIFASSLNEVLGEISNLCSPYDKVAILVNEKLAEIYKKDMEKLAGLIDSSQAAIIEVADGEEHKSLTKLEQLSGELASLGLSRQSCLIALGGGVTTDLVGFVAATYMRGIAYIQIPTSLLAQVDASIGGKTGVNLPQGKNLVGSFHPPQAVIILSDFLASLPSIERACGFAEIVKHGLLADQEFFMRLEAIANEKNMEEISPQEMSQIIRDACQIKLKIVQEDEFEKQSGTRALLNLGHTFAHALEAMSQYHSLKHGQAVAVGLVLASRVSKLMKDLSEEDCRSIAFVLEKFGLPTKPADGAKLDVDEMVKFMMNDKKHHDDRVPLVLLKSIGKAYVSEPYDRTQLKGLIQQALKEIT